MSRKTETEILANTRVLEQIHLQIVMDINITDFDNKDYLSYLALLYHF